MMNDLSSIVQKHVNANHLEDACFITSIDSYVPFTHEVILMPCAFSRYMILDQNFTLDYDLVDYMYDIALDKGQMTDRTLSLQEWTYVLTKLQVYVANRRFCGIYAVHEYDRNDTICLMPHVDSIEEFAIWVDLHESSDVDCI